MGIKDFLTRNVKDKHFGVILKGSLFSFFARGLAAVFTLVIQIVIARLYGPDILGATELINSFLMIIVVFALMGTQLSILRFIPEYTSKYSTAAAFKVYRKILFFILLSSIFIGTIIFFSADFISCKIFKKSQYVAFITLAAFFVPFRALQDFYMAVARGLKLINGFAILQFLPSLSNLLFLIVLTAFFYTENNPLYSLLFSFIAATVVGIIISERAFRRFEITKLTNKMLRDEKINAGFRVLLSVSFPMFLTTSMSYLNNQAGVLFLGKFSSQSDIAYYAIAVKLASLTTFVLIAINSMIAPKFSELYHSGNTDELYSLARKSTRLIFWSTFPLLLPLILFGKFILVNFFGKDFINSYIPLLILIVGQFINAISGSVAFFLSMTGNEKVVSIILSVSCFINIALCYFFVPRYGLYAASIASSVSMVVWNIAMIIYIKFRFGFLFIYVPSLTK